MSVRSLGEITKECIDILSINNDGHYSYIDSDYFDDIKSSDIDRVIELISEAIKQAKVDGNDEGSYVYRTLNIIKNDLNKNKLHSALESLKIIKDIVLPFDLKEFFELFDATLKTGERLSNKTCWVLLGATGAGKSTSIHYLCGSEFIKNDELGGALTVKKINMKSLKNKEIKIGTNVTVSETRHIDEIYLNMKEFGLKGKRVPKEVLLVDSPGFEDTAGIILYYLYIYIYK